MTDRFEPRPRYTDERRAAAPIVRCRKCGVLERRDRHVCKPENVERFEREVMRGEMTIATPAPQRTTA